MNADGLFENICSQRAACFVFKILKENNVDFSKAETVITVVLQKLSQPVIYNCFKMIFPLYRGKGDYSNFLSGFNILISEMTKRILVSKALYPITKSIENIIAILSSFNIDISEILSPLFEHLKGLVNDFEKNEPISNENSVANFLICIAKDYDKYRAISCAILHMLTYDIRVSRLIWNYFKDDKNDKNFISSLASDLHYFELDFKKMKQETEEFIIIHMIKSKLSGKELVIFMCQTVENAIKHQQSLKDLHNCKNTISILLSDKNLGYLSVKSAVDLYCSLVFSSDLDPSDKIFKSIVQKKGDKDLFDYFVISLQSQINMFAQKKLFDYLYPKFCKLVDGFDWKKLVPFMFSYNPDAIVDVINKLNNKSKDFKLIMIPIINKIVQEKRVGLDSLLRIEGMFSISKENIPLEIENIDLMIYRWKNIQFLRENIINYFKGIKLTVSSLNYLGHFLSNILIDKDDARIFLRPDYRYFIFEPFLSKIQFKKANGKIQSVLLMLKNIFKLFFRDICKPDNIALYEDIIIETAYIMICCRFFEHKNIEEIARSIWKYIPYFNTASYRPQEIKKDIFTNETVSNYYPRFMIRYLQNFEIEISNVNNGISAFMLSSYSDSFKSHNLISPMFSSIYKRLSYFPTNEILKVFSITRFDTLALFSCYIDKTSTDLKSLKVLLAISSLKQFKSYIISHQIFLDLMTEFFNKICKSTLPKIKSDFKDLLNGLEFASTFLRCINVSFEHGIKLQSIEIDLEEIIGKFNPDDLLLSKEDTLFIIVDYFESMVLFQKFQSKPISLLINWILYASYKFQTYQILRIKLSELLNSLYLNNKEYASTFIEMIYKSSEYSSCFYASALMKSLFTDERFFMIGYSLTFKSSILSKIIALSIIEQISRTPLHPYCYLNPSFQEYLIKTIGAKISKQAYIEYCKYYPELIKSIDREKNSLNSRDQLSNFDLPDFYDDEFITFLLSYSYIPDFSNVCSLSNIVAIWDRFFSKFEDQLICIVDPIFLRTSKKNQPIESGTKTNDIGDISQNNSYIDCISSTCVIFCIAFKKKPETILSYVLKKIPAVDKIFNRVLSGEEALATYILTYILSQTNMPTSVDNVSQQFDKDFIISILKNEIAHLLLWGIFCKLSKNVNLFMLPPFLECLLFAFSNDESSLFFDSTFKSLYDRSFSNPFQYQKTISESEAFSIKRIIHDYCISSQYDQFMNVCTQHLGTFCSMWERFPSVLIAISPQSFIREFTTILLNSTSEKIQTLLSENIGMFEYIDETNSDSFTCSLVLLLMSMIDRFSINNFHQLSTSLYSVIEHLLNSKYFHRISTSFNSIFENQIDDILIGKLLKVLFLETSFDSNVFIGALLLMKSINAIIEKTTQSNNQIFSALMYFVESIISLELKKLNQYSLIPGTPSNYVEIANGIKKEFTEDTIKSLSRYLLIAATCIASKNIMLSKEIFNIISIISDGWKELTTNSTLMCAITMFFSDLMSPNHKISVLDSLSDLLFFMSQNQISIPNFCEQLNTTDIIARIENKSLDKEKIIYSLKTQLKIDKVFKR